jgi:putative salt-induced outer membrane protein
MRSNVLSVWIVVVLALVVTPLAAQESSEQEAPEPAWTGNLGLSYLATSGNTDTQSFGLDFKMERRPDPWGVELIATMNRAEEDKVTTAERYLASARAKRTLSERWEYFAGLSGEQDEFAGIDLRALVETGAVYKVLLGPTHTLNVDGGLTYTDESRIEPEPDTSYLGGVAGLDYRWQISEGAAFTQRLLYYPNFDETSDWRVNSDTGLQAAVSKRLAVKVAYEIRYRNEPIGDNDSTDTTSKVSLVVNF